MSSASTNPYFYVRFLTNHLHANIMLARGFAVVPGLGMWVQPSVSHKLMYQCSCKGERGSNRSSRCQSDLSGRYGPTSHRIFQSACCSPASASVPGRFPMHALVLPHHPVHFICPLLQFPFGCFCVSSPMPMGLLENRLWKAMSQALRTSRKASNMWGLQSPR